MFISVKYDLNQYLRYVIEAKPICVYHFYKHTRWGMLYLVYGYRIVGKKSLTQRIKQALGSLQNLETMGGPFRGLLDSFALATSEWRTWFQTDAPQVNAVLLCSICNLHEEIRIQKCDKCCTW